MKASAIIIESLLKRFEDVTAVDGISLQIEEGELFGLLGPNGAGKTTIINILCGLIKPTNGSCKGGGYDVQEDIVKGKDLIRVCPQEIAVYSYLKGSENVDLFGNLYSMNKQMIGA